VIPWAPPVSQMEVPCYGNVARAPPLLIAKEQVRVERFFIEFWPFLKKHWEMNLLKTYFQVLSLSNHVRQVDVTYEGVVPCALVWLTFMWTSGGTLIQPVPPHFLVPKISHTNLNGVTHIESKFLFSLSYTVFL
jgi:hypothetical protein